MSGAPRTYMSRIAVATSSGVRSVAVVNRWGNARWSMTSMPSASGSSQSVRQGRPRIFIVPISDNKGDLSETTASRMVAGNRQGRTGPTRQTLAAGVELLYLSDTCDQTLRQPSAFVDVRLGRIQALASADSRL